VFAFDSRQPKKRPSRHLHGLRATSGRPDDLSRVTGSSGCEGAAITADEKNGYRQHDSEDQPELHFTGGPLEGLKLIGFGIWERRGGSGRNVTFPARQYSVNGEKRSFTLLRPIADAAAQERIRNLVLEAYSEYEQNATTA
jgi:hypothetical protein